MSMFFSVQGGHHASGCTPSAGVPSTCHPLVVALPHGPHTTPLREETYYYHPDHLGSTSWMTDHAGRVHEHVEYFPYGEAWRDSHLDEDPGPQPRTPAYLFTSKEYDPETKLYYYGARYYDPHIARWSASDPALESYLQRAPDPAVYAPANLSLYSYTWHNPVALRDPTGRFPVREYPWSPANLATHQRITTVALRDDFGSGALAAVIQANVSVDSDQNVSPASQAKHSMRNEHEGIVEAQHAAEALVEHKINLAVVAITKGQVDEARREFGMATHTAQDRDASAHTNEQKEPLVWRGTGHPIDAKKHIDIDMAERLEGPRAGRAVMDTRGLFNELKHRVLGDKPSAENLAKWRNFTGRNGSSESQTDRQ